jgi:superfamily II DNA helicase RecQ
MVLDVWFYLQHVLQVDGVLIYNGDLSDESRAEFLEDFQNRKFRVVVATISFGLGINIPFIDVIFHIGFFHLQIDQYLQQIGRAGRSLLMGLCHAIIIAYAQNCFVRRGLLSGLSLNHQAAVINALDSMDEFVKDTMSCCRLKLCQLYNPEQQVVTTLGCNCCNCHTAGRLDSLSHPWKCPESSLNGSLGMGPFASLENFTGEANALLTSIKNGSFADGMNNKYKNRNLLLNRLFKYGYLTKDISTTTFGNRIIRKYRKRNGFFPFFLRTNTYIQAGDELNLDYNFSHKGAPFACLCDSVVCRDNLNRNANIDKLKKQTSTNKIIQPTTTKKRKSNTLLNYFPAAHPVIDR